MSDDEGASASERAQELRASLGGQLEVEALLAVATATRQAAAAEADALVAQAQQLSAELLAESRSNAGQITAGAHDRAEGIVSRAREEGDDITRQARSSADAVRARAEAEVEEYRRQDRAEDRAEARAEQPGSATEAFLLSAHLDHGDPPLPPMDDDEIGARYARDAMRATARARSRQDPETLGVTPERPSPSRRGPDERGDSERSVQGDTDLRTGVRGEHADAAGSDLSGKPLGWLFRPS